MLRIASDLLTKLSGRTIRFYSKGPADAARPYEQGQIDVDIAGLPKDLATERLIADLTAYGVAVERQVRRIKALCGARKSEV